MITASIFLGVHLVTSSVNGNVTSGPDVIIGGSTTNSTPIVADKCNVISNAVVNAINLSTFNVVIPTNHILVNTFGYHVTGSGTFYTADPNFNKGSINIITIDPNGVLGGTSVSLNTSYKTNSNYTLTFVSYTNPAIILTNTFCWNLIDNMTRRTNSTSGFNYILKSGNTLVPPISMVPNFWLADVTNINGSSIATTNGQWLWELHPISPRHCLTARHVLAMNDRIWIMPDGSLYTNQCVKASSDNTNLLTGDGVIVLMAKTNPYVYKVLPNYSLKYTSVYSNAVTVVRGHYGSTGGNIRTFTSPIGLVGPANNYWMYGGAGSSDYIFRYGDYSLGDVWIGGDSSSPSWIILYNEAVLVGDAFTPQGDWAPGMNTNAVNAAMEYVSTNTGAPVYQVQPYDISVFPDL